MCKQPGLLNRNGTYYYRFIVPVDLVEAYGGRTVIKRSLKTKDFKEAKKRRNVEATKFDAKNEELRKRQISDPSVQDSIHRSEVAYCLESRRAKKCSIEPQISQKRTLIQRNKQRLHES